MLYLDLTPPRLFSLSPQISQEIQSKILSFIYMHKEEFVRV